MKTNEDPSIAVEETLVRLKGYTSSFVNDVEERILLKELYICCFSLKKYADEKSRGIKIISNAPKIVELEKRIEIAEDKVVALSTLTTKLENDSTELSDAIFLLKAKDNVLKEEISGIAKVDGEIRSDVESKRDELEPIIGALKNEDESILAKMSDGKNHIETELGTIDGKLEDIDLEGVEEQLLELEVEDDILKANVSTNHAELMGLIEEIEIKVDELELDALREDIVKLKEVDTDLTVTINALKEQIDTKIADLKEEDIEVRKGIDEVSDLLDEIKDNLVESSEVPTAGKVPLGLTDNFIDSGWIDPDLIG